jgi:hypothetical protein
MEYVDGEGRGGTQGDKQVLRLTVEGVKVYNGVIALFYAGAVKDYLLSRFSASSNPGSS